MNLISLTTILNIIRMSTWFTSDLHIGHKNLCEGLRGLSPDENDSLLLTNINKLVSKNDKLIIVGDLSMEKSDVVIEFLSKINCNTITIVGGNHDTEKCLDRLVRSISASYSYPLFHKNIRIVGCLNYKKYLVTHIPVHPYCLEGFKGNIHGHIHIPPVDKVLLGFDYTPRNLNDNRYFNVNVEFNNYNPWSFDEIEKRMNS